MNFTTNIQEVILNLYCSWKDQNLQLSISTQYIIMLWLYVKAMRESKVKQHDGRDQQHMQKLTIMREFL